jgi:hypothetical protein
VDAVLNNVGPWKNSTLVMVPSRSPALAASLRRAARARHQKHRERAASEIITLLQQTRLGSF